MRIGFGWIIFLSFCYHTLTQDEGEDDESVIELQLADFDLTDAYDEISEASKNYLLNITEYGVKIKMEKDLADLLRSQSKTNNELIDVPYEHNRKWDLLTKTGNFLLPKDEFDKLVNFSNENEELSRRAIFQVSGNSSEFVDEQGYLNDLAAKRNVTVLSELWSARQNIFYAKKDEFISVLSLLNKTCEINEEYSIKSFWEKQSEYDNGYEEAQNLWIKVRPLYNKIYDFVKFRISNHYGLDEDNGSIPVYLLGSNFGDDWTYIADIVLPHPYLYSEVNQKLKQQTVKSIFKLAERTTHNIGLGTLRKQFWKRSHFNFSSCGPHVFSHCNKEYTEILTCDKLDFTKFMDVHETAMNVALRNQDYSSLARREMRYSAVDEALQGLGSLMAINSLPMYGLVPQDKWSSRFDEENVRNSALLMIALKVLPKLPYYLLADSWRLNELESPGDNFTENWWLYRQQMQRVRSETNSEVDFLGDPLISSNKPYLSKFLGIFLQFQLYDYYNKYYSLENGTIVDFIKQDDSFMKFIADRPNKSWSELLNFYFNIDKVSPEALLEYFEPLEYYLEEVIYNYRMLSFSTMSDGTDNATDTESADNSTELKPAESRPDTSSFDKVWILLGVGALLLIALILFMSIRRLRRKKKTNNRRFET